MSGVGGAVVWAVVPYTPQAPFRIYGGPDREPFTVDGPRQLISAAKKGGDQEMTYLVTGKVRPVLILSDAHDSDLGEYLALRLARFSKLTVPEQERIRAQKHPTLFHLRPAEFAGLSEENAAMIAGLVRLHRSAVDTQALGRLDANELGVVHQRFAAFHRFDLRALVLEKLQELKAKQEQRQSSA